MRRGIASYIPMALFVQDVAEGQLQTHFQLTLNHVMHKQDQANVTISTLMPGMAHVATLDKRQAELFPTGWCRSHS